jgi:ribosomal protein S8
MEGEGKTMRHIKLRSQRDVERPFLRRYIQTAMEQAARSGAGGTGKSVVKTERGVQSKRHAKKPRRK